MRNFFDFPQQKENECRGSVSCTIFTKPLWNSWLHCSLSSCQLLRYFRVISACDVTLSRDLVTRSPCQLVGLSRDIALEPADEHFVSENERRRHTIVLFWNEKRTLLFGLSVNTLFNRRIVDRLQKKAFSNVMRR